MTPSPRKRDGADKGTGRARRERSAGGVVLLTHTTQDASGDVATPLFLLIRDSYGKWGFPKGHVERGERADRAALREVMEETGLRELALVGTSPIATIEWYFRFRGQLIHKSCQYFLMETSVERTKPQKSEGITACRWSTAAEARDLIPYDNARDVLERAHALAIAHQAVAAAGD